MDFKKVENRELLFRDDRVRRFIDLVRLRPVKEIECIDLHINQFLIIERLVLLFAFLVPEDDNAVLHFLAAGDVVHTVRWEWEIMNVTTLTNDSRKRDNVSFLSSRIKNF